MPQNSVELIIRANVKNFVKGVKQAENEFKRSMKNIRRSAGRPLKDPFTNVTKGAGQAQTSVAGLAKTVLAGAAAYVSFRVAIAGVSRLLETGGNFERLRVQLNSLMKSVAGGGKAFDWIVKFTREVPFQIKDVTRAFVMMKATGMDPTDGSMRKLVDAASMLGGSQEDLLSIARAVGQMWAKQKIRAQEMNLQLTERGVPAWELLSKATGKSVTELIKMSEAGKLGRDAIRGLIDEIGKWADGAAIAQMKTWVGLVSNAKDIIDIFLDSVSKAGVLNYFKGLIEDALATIKKMRADGSLQEWAQSTSDIIEHLSRAVLDVVKAMVKWKGTIIAITGAGALVALLSMIRLIAPAVVALKTELLALAATPAGIILVGFGLALAAAADMAHRSSKKMVAAARQREAAFKSLGATMQTLEEIQRKLNQTGFGKTEAARAVKEYRRLGLAIREAIQAGKSTPHLDFFAEEAKQATASAREIIALQDEIAAKKKSVADLGHSLASANKEFIIKAARDELEQKIQTAQKAIQTKKRELNASLRAEKGYVNEVARLRQELANRQSQAADSAFDKELKGLSASAQQSKIWLKAWKEIRKAQSEWLQGNFKLAESHALAGKALGERLTNEREAGKVISEANKQINSAINRQIDKALEAEAVEKAKSATLKEEIEKQKKAIEGFNAKLKALTETDNRVKITADIKQAEDDLVKLKKELKELAKGITIPIKTVRTNSGGGSTDNAPAGFAAGGRLPGFGGGDRINALLEAGEWVINKKSTRYYGDPLMNAINQMKISRGSLLNAMNLPRFVHGGSVLSRLRVPSLPTFATGGKAGGAQEVDHFINIGSKRIGPVRGAPDVVTELVDALNKEGLGFA